MEKKVELTPVQKQAMEVARVGLMNYCPFFAYYFYAEMEEWPTNDVQSAETDGRRIFYNPEYMANLKPPERIFALAHEVFHTIWRHPQRGKHYRSAGNLRGLPWSMKFANICMDYVINADLIANGIGLCNPAWLYDPAIKGTDLWEDVYEKHFPKNPPPQGGKGQGQGSGSPQGQPHGHQPKTKGGTGKPDPHAQANGGSFDECREPQTDPVTGKEDIPGEAEFKEAIARAAAAAKAMGKMPGSLQRIVDEILEPQVNWREHVRMLLTGKMGSRSETWDRPNRRRLVLNPMVIMPGRKGFGAETVACVIDNSGSIHERELSAFFAEVGGVIADVRPRRVILIWCDAQVRQVDEASTLDEMAYLRVKGSPGGGRTSFIPPFEYLKEQGIKPDTLIYLTDLYGSFPDEPAYPVVWCATTDQPVPFGDLVRIKL